MAHRRSPPRKAARRKTTRRNAPRRAAHRGPKPGVTGATAYLAIDGAANAVGFYQNAFGAKEVLRESGPDGKLIHCRLQIGKATIMLSDTFEGAPMVSPARSGATTVMIHLDVGDARAAWERAVNAGATVLMPLGDMYWGMRYGMLKDPFGHQWSLGQPIRLTAAQREAKRKEAMAMFESAGAPPGPPP